MEVIYKTSADGTCPICSDEIDNEFLLGKHLLAVHKVCINTKMKINGNEEWYRNRWYSIGEDDYTTVLLGNKMRALKCILKENFCLYIEKLKDWIKCKISRMEFEESVVPLFNENSVLIHNEFVICFLNEIRSITQETKSTSRKRTNMDNLSLEDLQQNWKNAASSAASSSIHRDVKKMSIPDDETLHALTLVNAWEANCAPINKKILPLLQKTKEELSKLIRDAVLYRRRAIYVRPDGYEYDVTDVKDKDVTKFDLPKYSGSITVGEIKDAIRNEKSLQRFRRLV